MMALTYTRSGKLELGDVPLPVLHKDNAVMKVLSASICGTDLRIYRGGNGRIRAPRVIGHEMCGIIESVGSDVEGVDVGDRVVVAPAVGCGSCRFCESGSTNMCDDLRTIGFDYDGSFSEYMEIPSRAIRMNNVIKLEPSVPSTVASLAEPIACCLNGQEHLAIGTGDYVVVIGAGFIGCIHAELALKAGAEHVLVAGLSDARLKLAEKLVPGIETINSSRDNIVERVRRTTGNGGADVVITANSDGRSHETALEIAAKRARISLFGGVPSDGKRFLDSNLIHYRELSVHGAHATTPRLVRFVLNEIADGNLEPSKYISREYPLEQIMDAFEAFRGRDVIRIVIRP